MPHCDGVAAVKRLPALHYSALYYFLVFLRHEFQCGAFKPLESNDKLFLKSNLRTHSVFFVTRAFDPFRKTLAQERFQSN